MSNVYKSALLPVLVFIVIHLGQAAFAQTSSIQGIITDSSNGDALYTANIALLDIPEDGIRGTITDQNGFYQIGNIQPGSYLLRITYIGYVTYTDTLNFSDSESRSISVALLPDERDLGEVVVTAGGSAAQREGGLQRISTIDIQRIPTPGGGGDLASYLQSLPGVVTTGDRGGGLFIRGGTPSENMVLVDGTLIYQPFHIVGFFSAFPEELVSGTDFYAGGFGPRYNSRLSSVLDVRMRNGNRDQFKGTGSISPFLGEAVVEGPMGGGEYSFIGSVRRSLIEETSPAFMESQPLRFESQYLKFSHLGNNDSRCSAMMMRTYDRGSLDFESDDIFRWTNFVAGAQCVMLPENLPVLFDMNIGVSYVSNAAGSGNSPERFSKATRLNIDLNMTRFFDSVRFDYGVFTHMLWLNYDMSEQFFRSEADDENLLGSGAYVDFTIPLSDRMEFIAGSSISLYRYVYAPSVEPRLRFAWQPFGRETEELNAAFGIHRQPLAGITDMRDAGSAFTAWMPVPIGEDQMEATHALLGWRQTLGGGFNISVEGYYKWLRSLPVAVWSSLAQFNTDLALADGYTYGGDIRLDFTRGSFYGFVGYGYGLTEYESAQDHFSLWFGEPVQQYNPAHDRRHQINSLLSLDLGKYTTSARWQFGTGLPFTRPLGFDEYFSFDENVPEPKDQFGTPRVILNRPFNGRMPIYHRLDVSIEREFEFISGANLTLQAGAVNLYDQTNMFYYDVYTQRRIDQLSFAPYVSLKLETR